MFTRMLWKMNPFWLYNMFQVGGSTTTTNPTMAVDFSLDQKTCPTNPWVCQASAETSDLDIFQSYQRWQPLKWLALVACGWWLWWVVVRCEKFRKNIPSKELNISHPRAVGKMSFLSHWWDMLGPLEGILKIEMIPRFLSSLLNFTLLSWKVV